VLWLIEQKYWKARLDIQSCLVYDFLLSPVARTEGGDRVAGEEEEVRQGRDGVGQLLGEETGEEETPAGGEAETQGRGPAGCVRVRG